MSQEKQCPQCGGVLPPGTPRAQSGDAAGANAGSTGGPRTSSRLVWLALAAALLAYVALRWSALGSLMGPQAQTADGGLLASRGSLPERALLAGNLTLRYLLRCVVPWPLSLETSRALQHPPYPLGLGLIGLAAGALALFGLKWFQRLKSTSTYKS